MLDFHELHRTYDMFFLNFHVGLKYFKMKIRKVMCLKSKVSRQNLCCLSFSHTPAVLIFVTLWKPSENIWNDTLYHCATCGYYKFFWLVVSVLRGEVILFPTLLGNHRTVVIISHCCLCPTLWNYLICCFKLSCTTVVLGNEIKR